MSNQKKIQILNKMGIDVWVPLDSQLLKKKSIENNIRSIDFEIKQSDIEENKSLLVEPAKEEDQNPPKKPLQVSGVNFNLNIMIIEDLMIIDDVSELKYVKSMYSNWFRSIFFALGHKDKLNLDYEQFDWPINNNSVDCTLESAKDVFFSWLKRKKELNDVNKILLMGKASANIADQHSSMLGKKIFMKGFEHSQIFMTFGTTELWKNPSIKKDFWEHLKIFLS